MQNTDSNQRDIFSVSQLNRRTRQLLETHLPLIWVEGELSNFARPSSGHWYFSLKDDNAQVRCAMFRNRNSRVRLSSGSTTPGNGMQVLVRCRVSLYEGRGEFQLIIEHMEEAGLGALQRRFEQLKQQLASEGLFETQSKLPLPEIPHHIGVVTSPTGAAIHDILQVLKRRFPAIPVTIYPTVVQGQAAISGIVNAIESANNHKRCDVLIVGRGGGSMEDLWAFNEESVARAIFASDIPIVSAVGHEVDFTIADFVADHRAATPSAAAELLSPDQQELYDTLNGYQGLLASNINRYIEKLGQKLQQARQQLRHPGEHLREQSQHLDHLELRLQSALMSRLHHSQSRYNKVHSRFERLHPNNRVTELTQQCAYLSQRLTTTIQRQLELRRQKLSGIAQVLQAVSPLNTLSRGYSITRDDNDSVVRQATDVKVGQRVVTRISDGQLHCTIEKIAEVE